MAEEKRGEAVRRNPGRRKITQGLMGLAMTVGYRPPGARARRQAKTSVICSYRIRVCLRVAGRRGGLRTAGVWALRSVISTTVPS